MTGKENRARAEARVQRSLRSHWSYQDAPFLRRTPLAPSILLIAPIQKTGASHTNVVGGNKVTADDQVRELGARGFEVDVIDTSGGVTNLPAWKIRAHRLARFLRVTWGAARKLWRSDVVFLIIGSSSALCLASFLWAVCKIARRPLVLRVTGGDMMLDYLGYGAFARWLANRTWMRSSLVYVETQYLYRGFDNRDNFKWFPGTRSMEAPPRTGHGRVEKLIFVARLVMDKGLAEALEACRHLPEHCHLNVFGPGMSDTDFSLFEDHPRATYGGVLDPADIPGVLSEHDLLVYPSYYRSEGYPGAILEAFQCGLPVVAARMGGVSELVEHEESGLLVEPRSAAEVESAIKRLLDEPDLYRRLCEGAKRRGDQFRSADWYDRVAADLHRLCRKQTPHGRLAKRP